MNSRLAPVGLLVQESSPGQVAVFGDTTTPRPRGTLVITVGRNAVRDGTEVQVLEAQPKAVAKGSGAGQQEAAQ